MSQPTLTQFQIYINALGRMYDENNRQITELQQSNIQIRSLITNAFELVNQSQPRGQPNPQQSIHPNIPTNIPANIPTNTPTNTPITTSAITSTGNGRGTRVTIDGVSYIVDNVEQYTYFPSSNRVERSNAVDNLDTDEISQLFRSLLEGSMIPSTDNDTEIVPLTREQINANTRSVQYCNILNPLNTTCPITLVDFSDSDMVTVIRRCGHVFDTQALTRWFSVNCRCPICRQDLRVETPTENSSRSIVPPQPGQNTETQSTTQTTQSTQSTTDNISSSDLLSMFFDYSIPFANAATGSGASNITNLISQSDTPNVNRYFQFLRSRYGTNPTNSRNNRTSNNTSIRPRSTLRLDPSANFGL